MRKWKLFLILTLSVVLLLPTATSFANPIKVQVNGNELKLNVDPISRDGRTLVPLRAIFEALGASVDWDNDTRTVTGTQGSRTIVLEIDNKNAKVDGKDVVLDVPATIVSGNTLVPVRFIAESLGAYVDWNNTTRTVIIKGVVSPAPDSLYKVVHVSDGDTIIVDIEGVRETVRLIGVDTPESVHSDSTLNTLEGDRASLFTALALEGKEVGIELDKELRDKYGRLLAYVWIGGEMFNKTLVQNGYGTATFYPPNVKYTDEFNKLQEEAKNNNRGFWINGEFTTTQKSVSVPVQGVAQLVPEPTTTIQPATQNTGVSQVIPSSNTYTTNNDRGNPDTAMFWGSVKSDKYHYPNYKHTGQISLKNLRYFESIEDAKSKGYSPCSICFN